MGDLINKRVLFAAQFAAPYKGNFLLSLEALEKKLESEYSATCGYLFPKAAEKQDWYPEFAKSHKVYLSGDNNILISETEAENIIKDFQPDIIHTHFEGYDTQLFYAARKYSDETKVVWHMHDTLKFQPHLLKALYQVYCFFKHYGYPFIKFPKTKRPSIIAVNPHELRFIAKFRGKKKANQRLIANGVDTSRLSFRNKTDEGLFTFLAYGGRNIQKRIDLIYQASEILSSKGIKFKLYITKGTDTQEVADKYFGNEKPQWLQIIEPVSDINILLNKADCFISSSQTETFSFGVCEASIFGLPVIQSDIEGTKWNAANPSTFLFKNLDATDLANKMGKVMSIPKERLKHLTEETRRNNLSKYSFDVWTDNIIDFYKSL